MVSHRGTPVSFAMVEDGRIFYSVLDMSNTEQNANQVGDNDNDRNNDKNYWSKVNFEGVGASRLQFPIEIMQVGYGVVPNFLIDKYDSSNNKIIHKYNLEGKPLDQDGKELSEPAIKDKTDPFYSSTARLGANVPFQVLSDGKYIYVFRQSIAASDSNNENNENPAIVNNTLLVDRFILSGTTLKLSREIRYQRSRHKTEPESRKDTLSAVDVEGKPFYQPTRELVFANNLSNGNFSVLLLPGADSEEQRWQIFTTDAVTRKINSFNIRFDNSIVFDTSDSQTVVNEFIEKYGIDDGLVAEVQAAINQGDNDDRIASALLSKSPYSDKGIPQDELTELVYIIRTGVVKDDFIPASVSQWPLIEYESDGTAIKAEYTVNGVLKKEYAFQAPTDELKPQLVQYQPAQGLSSCYYYQQEMGADNKPMKNKACVMLAIGLEDKKRNQYIGILNFSAAASGRLSRLTTDTVNMPDINVQALDENPYRDLKSLQTVAWQQPQKMRLLDIDPNGLSTSGGVLKFAYTSADIGISAGYSDAVVATDPYLFDDSLGRVNLYFKGRDKNFFVLYFNPTGGKSVQVTDSSAQAANPPLVNPPLSLKPRLDRDITLDVVATLPKNSNTCTLTMTSQGSLVEQWHHLPRRLSQIANILNGSSQLPLGTLEPLGNTGDPRAAYIKPQTGNGTLKLRTTVENTLIFQAQNFYANPLADGNTHSLPLSQLSTYLANNPDISIAKRSFSLSGDAVLQADLFFKSYLSSMVADAKDITTLWNYLNAQSLIQDVSGKSDRAHLRSAALTGTATSLSAVLTDREIDALSLELLREGNAADKKARKARLKQSLIALLLDVAKVRIISFTVQDTNVQSVDRLEAGLAVNVEYDYATHFICTPANLDGTSASKWEHSRSYLFNAEVQYDATINTTTEISPTFNYHYEINNTIGQWEDWEASLALEFNPASATNGALLNTDDSGKLEALQPTEKGLSVEAWVKPANILNNPGSILYYKNGALNYSLGIEKDSADSSKYKCVATLGDNKYTSKNAFAFQNSQGKTQNSQGKEQWRHLAFTHRKYWGYQLNPGNTINCGNDSSLQLVDEFTLEVLVQIDTAGTLLEKTDEYRLSVKGNHEVVFDWAGTNDLEEWVEMDRAPTSSQQRDTENYKRIDGVWHQRNKPDTLDSLKQFYKIVLIRSKNKPQTDPTKVEYPITGGDRGGDTDSGPKWYEDKSSEEIVKGMAEKQDQMDNSMKLSQTNMLGNIADPASEYSPKYYHTLVVTKSDNSTTEWTATIPREVGSVEAYQDFIVGGNGFSGRFASVRIWNRALSISEAKTLAMPENKTGLLSYWRMSEGKGTYLYDNTSENHGVAVGGAWTDSPQTGRAGQFQFYVDGSPEKHDPPTRAAAVGVDQFSIGGIKNASGSRNHFQGTVEEIRVWNLPRTNEQITDNAFGRLKGEWEQLLANYTFDRSIDQTDNKVQDSSANSTQLTVHPSYPNTMLQEVLSTAPIATEIPQVRSALTGVLTEYNGTLHCRPGVVEYGDVQKNDDGTLNGILKRCYSFIDEDRVWNRMTGYKVGNLVSQWYGQAQFAPQVMGYLEGPPPVPAENFPIREGSGSFRWNSVSFKQAEEVSYNYSTSKEAGWKVAVESEGDTGIDISTLIAPLGFGLSFKGGAQLATASNWETAGNRSQSFERGTRANTDREFNARLAGYDDGTSDAERCYKLGNTGYALVKSKTADIYLLRLAHNQALVSISWQPNPDIPEDVNIIPFPIDPLYTKQGTLDGKLGETTDNHYPQAQGAYGQYSYFKPREAYQLKKQIEREKMELQAYFEDSFDVAKTNAHFQAAASTTGVAQLATRIPVAGALFASAFNQVAGQLATQIGYNNTELKDDLVKMGSQRNLMNTYVWTVEGGFYAESTEVAETQQETYANETSLSLGGGLGLKMKVEGVGAFEQKSLFSSGSSFTLTKSKTRKSSNSFGLEVSVRIPTSPRYQYAGTDGRTLTQGLIKPGTVDAYRFMSFYLEPKGKNFIDLFSTVVDPIWLDESPDPNAQALRQARGNVDQAKPCWRIMHRVTYVSRILPEFQPEAPPSLEQSMRVSGIESNYMLIKKFEPYVANITNPGDFFSKIEAIIDAQLPEFAAYKQQIKYYLALYFNIDLA